LYKHLHMILL